MCPQVLPEMFREVDTTNGKRKCHAHILYKMAQWTKRVEGIRIAKISKKANSAGSTISYHYIPNNDRPDKAHTTEGHFGLVLTKQNLKRNILSELDKPGKTGLKAGNGELIFLTQSALLAIPD